MDSKYSNIFWHQGVKVFRDNVLGSKQGQIKVAHLENDVTKALLNLFEHCGPKVFQVFLKMIGIRQAPESFKYDFQVNDPSKYRYKKKKIMLTIISASTPRKNDPSYFVQQSIPDACIYNQDTAILVESKTQSPLVYEQIQGHIRQYLGTVPRDQDIVRTWEDIYEVFQVLSKSLSGLDRFLVDQFCNFLDLIGISKFNGFSESDFSMLGSLGKIPDEDYADFKRLFEKKVTKFMDLLKDEVTPILDFKKSDIYISKLLTQTVGTHSGFYFFNEKKKIHINHLPNININFDDHCMELAVNAETQSSVKQFLSSMENKSQQIDDIASKITDMKLLIFYKLQYRPMDNFVWNLIPGFPKESKSIKSQDIITEVQQLEVEFGSGFDISC